MKAARAGYYDYAVGICILVIFAITLAVDFTAPLGYSVWLGYFIAMVLSFSLSFRWLPAVIAASATLVMLLGYQLDPRETNATLALVNRSLASISIALLAIAGTILIRNRLRIAGADWRHAAEIRLAKALEGDLSRAEIGNRSLSLIGELLEARASVLWGMQEGALVPLSSWGTAETPQPLQRDAPGRNGGHLWRALGSDRALVLTAPAGAALNWGTALMQGRAACSVIIPTRENGQTNGLIELGLDQEPDESTLALLETLGMKIGIELRSAVYRDELQHLLDETRQQAEELHSHAERLAATNEELEEQTEALRRSDALLRDQQAALEEQNTELEAQTAQLEEQRDALAQSGGRLAAQAEELARESRYKSEFVANMSHELRTPLNALLIMARLITENRQGNLTTEQTRWAETIESSGKDLLRLINDILDLARIEAGKVEISPEPSDPRDIARRIARAFASAASDKGLSLEVDLEPDLPEIITDPARVEQILRNFVGNALKFTAKGSVTLSARREGEGVALSVSDTGIGIDALQHKAVFEAFRQADGSISRKFGGTGLGLAISRDLSILLEGSISLDSRPGEGSTFTLHLPAAILNPGEPESAGSAPSPGAAEASSQAMIVQRPAGRRARLADDRNDIGEGDRSLLIVEDDAAFAGILLDLAHERQFSAIIVSTADEAVRAAKTYLPQGVILDMGLPDHSGLTVLDRLKRDPATRHIPVHVVSAADHTRDAMAKGAVNYLLKPVAREDLLGALDSISQQADARIRHLLVVEDDPAQLSGIKSLLGSDEVEVTGVSSTAEALAACRAHTFDCIVLDLNLPDGSGFDLLEQLNSDDSASFPPVIVYTARALSEAEERRLRRYSQSIIIKGAKSPERLIDEVTLFLHQVVSDLPQKQREMLAASLNRDAELEGRRILVVEDDVRNIYALTGVLEPHGVQVSIARNGREALDRLGRIADGSDPQIDLVLMDVMMPEMDGLTATREIRRIPAWRSLPIIMLTAKAMADDQAKCLAAGANDYLAKPLDVDKLLSLIRVWMPQ